MFNSDKIARLAARLEKVETKLGGVFKKKEKTFPSIFDDYLFLGHLGVTLESRIENLEGKQEVFENHLGKLEKFLGIEFVSTTEVVGRGVKGYKTEKHGYRKVAKKS